ncbi:MAG TPA: protein-L-isoaspartate(D-aspartate) O-methyltransferase [Crenalkalicoccus sp.]|nr:protein-L-isoaspartate(D-aspartate) O-methyltransferase [Crenalkalicoccus sp.]
MKPMNEGHLAILRRHMVEVIMIETDLMEEELGKAALEQRVLTAIQRVPRHFFVPLSLAAYAYRDTPLPIGFDKTISQPFIGALMIDLLSPESHEVVLEIGTGLGYQAAVLAELAARVWSVEIVEELASLAELRLQQLGYSTISIRVGDGSRGWVEHAPYDRILVTAAADQPPLPLLEQLKPGGRMVMPLGGAEEQQLTIIDKDQLGNIFTQELIPVRFSRLETII